MLPFHFSNLECCQYKVSNPGTADSDVISAAAEPDLVLLSEHVRVNVCVILDLFKCYFL